MRHVARMIGTGTALMLLALPLALAAAQAPPSPQPEPPPQAPDEPAVEPEPEPDTEATPDGYDTPREAAETFFGALKADDYDRLRTTLPADIREGFDRLGPAWVKALDVSDYEILAVEEPEVGTAHAYYEWDVEIDMEEVADEFSDLMVESLREQGLSEEDIEAFLDIQMQVIRGQLDRQAKQMERDKQRMILTEIDGRWYVDTPADEDYDPEAQEEQQEGGETENEVEGEEENRESSE